MSYQVICEWDGEQRFFYSKDKAKAYKRAKKEQIHQTFCVDKKLGRKNECLCTLSGGERECSAHSYWKTMVSHTAKDCEHTGKVHIETVEVDD